jgi:hypothetical protein
MGYLLRMSAEIYEWLAELRDSDPPAAVLTTQALAALAAGGGRIGPPLVTAADGRLHPDELPSAMDWRYQAWLESLTGIRRQAARAATLRKDLEQQLARPEPSPALAERLAEAREAEQRLAKACLQEQLRADTFRARKEVLKAALIGAQAEQLLDPTAAAARLYEIISWIEPELDLEPPAEGLMELRPGAPADSGIRILFAVEPPGTAFLIAVLEGTDAIREHHREAVLLASEALQEARSGQAPEEPGHEFADARSFLEEFVR